MAQPLKSINLVAPAFRGINTEDSPIAQDPSFAEVADNAIIDKRGRIAARKGITVLTTNTTASTGPLARLAGTNPEVDFLHTVHYFFDESNEEVFSSGNNKLFSGISNITDITPSNYTITSNDWKMVNFNNKCYFFQRGYEPLVYADGVGLKTFGDAAVNGSTPGFSATSAFMKCHEAIASYGRLWIADSATESQAIHWSDLLLGNIFGPDAVANGMNPGSSGTIDVSKAWPDGHDQIVALAAHNNTLIVFGKHSILVYGNAFSPANMFLVDTIAGVGCIDRNSVQHIGTDVLFMSYSGLRSLGRVIQEKSLPLSDLSGTIKTELIEIIERNTSPVSSVYSPENSFYLITFPDDEITFCFNLKSQLENGAYRVTRWPASDFKSFARKNDGTLYVGTHLGVGTYSGYSDNGVDYRFRYYSPALSFGDPTKLKFLKKLTPTVIGAEDATVVVKWGYDLTSNYNSYNLTVGDLSSSKGEWGLSKYVTIGSLSGYTISSVFVAASQYLGSSASAPTTGSGGGALLTGDSYLNTTSNKYFARASSFWFEIPATPVGKPTHVNFGSGYFVVPNYLGEFTSNPTTGSQGGAVLAGDSYFNTTDNKYFVYTNAWTDLTTLTVTESSDYTGGVATSRRTINTTGNGALVTIGAEADINGSALSLQEINVLALIGRTI